MNTWNKTHWRELESFLQRNGFNRGWSAHTWQYLPRNIQATWETK